jgi:hypothetical protein
MLIGAGVSAYGQVQQGKQAEAMGDYQADQAAADASAERGAAQVEADMIRKAAGRQAAAQRAALAASGVEATGEGTALTIQEDTYQSANQDAAMGIYGAADRARRINAQGDADKISGEMQNKAAKIGAAATVLSAASNNGKGWKTQ